MLSQLKKYSNFVRIFYSTLLSGSGTITVYKITQKYNTYFAKRYTNYANILS